MPVAFLDVVLHAHTAYSISIFTGMHTSVDTQADYSIITHTNVIVADAVTLVFCNSTIGCLELRVQTFAFEAEFKLVIIAIVTTAVATVPATSAAVVV